MQATNGFKFEFDKFFLKLSPKILIKYNCYKSK